MYPFERPQEVAHIGPQAFRGVTVHFADVIPIVITGPLVVRVLHSCMFTQDVIVALLLVGIERAVRTRKALHVRPQDFASGVVQDADTDLPGFTSDGAHDGRAVIGVRTASAPLVGPAAGRVRAVEVFVSCFPPRSETFRLSQSVRLRGGYPVVIHRHYLADRGAVPTRWCSAVPVRVRAR